MFVAKNTLMTLPSALVLPQFVSAGPLQSYPGGGATSLSWNETAPTCNLAILWVSDVPYGTQSAASLTATLGGVNMLLFEFFIGVFFDGTNDGYDYLCAGIMLNPPAGSNHIVVSDPTADFIGFAQIAYYSNVAGVGFPLTYSVPSPNGTTLATGTSLTQTVSSSSSSLLYAQCFCSCSGNVGDVLNGYNQTQRSSVTAETADANGDSTLLFGDAVGNGGSLTFSATISARDFGHGGLLFPLYATLPPALTVLGSGKSATTSVTIPTHSAGDIIVIFAYNGSSGTNPAIPTASGTVPAWVNIVNGNANTNAERVAYFVATASNHTSGTWTSATAMIAVVISPSLSIGNPLGSYADGGSTGTTSAVASAVTPLAHSDNTSVVLKFFGCRTSTTWSAAPTGFTQLIGGTGNVCLDVETSTTSGDATATQAHSSITSTGYRAVTVEIVAY